MKTESTKKAGDKTPSATSSEKSAGVEVTAVSKAESSDENIEHILRRAALEKEKKRSKNPGMYL